LPFSILEIWRFCLNCDLFVHGDAVGLLDVVGYGIEIIAVCELSNFPTPSSLSMNGEGGGE